MNRFEAWVDSIPPPEWPGSIVRACDWLLAVSLGILPVCVIVLESMQDPMLAIFALFLPFAFIPTLLLLYADRWSMLTLVVYTLPCYVVANAACDLASSSATLILHPLHLHLYWLAVYGFLRFLMLFWTWFRTRESLRLRSWRPLFWL